MRAKFLRVGPNASDGGPTLELEMASGEAVVVPLDREYARSVASRLLACVEGTARRTLELELEPAFFISDDQLSFVTGHA